MASQEQLEKLIQTLMRDPSLYARESAAFALSKLVRNERKALSELVEPSPGEDSAQRSAIFDRLVDLIPQLIEILRNEEYLTDSVAQVLGDLGEEARPAVPVLIEEFNRRSGRNSELIGMALGQIGGDEVVRAFNTGLCFRNEFDRKRMESIWGALAEIGDPAFPMLIRLTDNDDQLERVSAIMNLKHLNYPAAKLIPLLIKELNSEINYNDALDAVASLLVQMGKGNDQVIAAVAELLNGNSRGWAKYHAARILAQLGASAIPALRQALKNGIETSAVIEALGQIGGAAIDYLVETLKTTDDRPTGARIIATLSQAGERGLLTLIETVNHHQDRVLRGEAAIALSRRDFETSRDRVIAVLKQSLADRDSGVRYAAAHALEILGHSHLISFQGKPEIRDAFLARVKADEDADELAQDNPLNDADKQCNTVECHWHRGLSYLKSEGYEIGISHQLAETAYALFKALPDHHAAQWALNFLEAVPVGINLDPVEWNFLHWFLVDETYGVYRFAITDHLRVVIERVADLNQQRIKGEIIREAAWFEALEAASDAGQTAYDFEAQTSDVSEVDAPAASAACAAFAAAGVAREALFLDSHSIFTATDHAARANAYASADPIAAKIQCQIRQSEKLLELLRMAK